MTMTRKEFLQGAAGMAVSATLSPVVRTVSAVLGAAAVAGRTARATPTVLVGADSTNPGVYGSGSPNIVVSSLFTAAASGTATSLSVDIYYETGDPIKLSIWTADGLTKLGETAAFADAVGVQTANLLAGVSITASTDYLLVAMSSGPYIWLYNDNTGFYDFTTDATYPTWPSTIPLYSNSGGGKVAIWANADDATFDYYISPSGSNLNDGLTTLTPWAITALNSKRATYSPSGVGRTIGLMDGTYDISGLMTNVRDTPALDVDGGTSGHPVILRAVNPRAAIIDAGGATAYNSNNAMMGHTTAVSHQGYLVVDSLKFTGGRTNILEIGTYSISSALAGIVIQNCEFTGNDDTDSNPGGSNTPGSGGGNASSVTLNNCDGALVKNNYFHDNYGFLGANSGDHISAIIVWLSAGTVIEYNTSIHSGIGIYGKEMNIQGTIARYNYVDCSMYTDDGCDAMGDFSGAPTMGLTQLSSFHHNILLGCRSGFDAYNVLAAGPWTTDVELYNNTIVMNQISGGPPPYVEVAFGIFASSRTLTVYNNIFTGDVSVDNRLLKFNPNAPALWDYNLFPNSGTLWRLASDVDGSTGTDYSSLTTLRSDIVTAGGISGFEAHGVASSSAGFVGTGSRADKYKLSGGSAAVNAGKSDGTTGGTTCDIGAWGNGAPTVIGCDF